MEQLSRNVAASHRSRAVIYSQIQGQSLRPDLCKTGCTRCLGLGTVIQVAAPAELESAPPTLVHRTGGGEQWAMDVTAPAAFGNDLEEARKALRVLRHASYLTCVQRNAKFQELSKKY